MVSPYGYKFSFAVLGKPVLMVGLPCLHLASVTLVDSQGRRLDSLFLDISNNVLELE